MPITTILHVFLKDTPKHLAYGGVRHRHATDGNTLTCVAESRVHCQKKGAGPISGPLKCTPALLIVNGLPNAAHVIVQKKKSVL